MAVSTKRYIAIDLGATGGKVVLASVTAGAVTTETLHGFSLPHISLGGQEYWDIFAAYAGILQGLTVAGSRKLEIESIGIDSWGPGVVCVARDGNLLGLPRIFSDVLSGAVHAKFFKRMERRELYETSGVNVLDSQAALQLFSLRRTKSIALEDAKHLLLIPDAITYLLTGKRFSDFTSMSASGLVDRGTKKLSRDILSACKVRPRRFPSMVQPGAKSAKLTEEVAHATGLGRVPVMAVAGHDLASAAAALPLSSVIPGATAAESGTDRSPLFSGEGIAFLRLGTVSVLGVETVSPMVNDQTFEMNFSNESGVGGVNLLVKRIPGCDMLDKCLKQWSLEGKDYSMEEIARMALEGPGTNAQLDPEDAALLSSSDMPAAIGRYCTLRSMSVPEGDAAIVRLVCSSLAEKIGDTFTRLQSVTPFRIKSLCIIGDIPLGPVYTPAVSSREGGDGAGSFVPFFCQLIANECSVPVLTGPEDAAVLGNVLVQAGLTRQALASTFTPVTYTPGI